MGFAVREYHEAWMDLVDSSELKRIAIELGFTTVGVAPAVPIPEALRAYHDWLGRGYHAKCNTWQTMRL